MFLQATSTLLLGQRKLLEPTEPMKHLWLITTVSSQLYCIPNKYVHQLKVYVYGSRHWMFVESRHIDSKYVCLGWSAIIRWTGCFELFLKHDQLKLAYRTDLGV